MPGGDGGRRRVIAPLTNWGDAIGVLDLTLPPGGRNDGVGMLNKRRSVGQGEEFPGGDHVLAMSRSLRLAAWNEATGSPNA